MKNSNKTKFNTHKGKHRVNIHDPIALWSDIHTGITAMPSFSVIPKEEVKGFTDKVELWTKSCGLKWTIVQLKELRMLIVHYLNGKPATPTRIVGMKRGLPKALGPLRKYVESLDPDLIRHVLTILSIYRNERVDGVPNTSSISQGPTYSLADANATVEEVCKTLKECRIVLGEPNTKSLHFTDKSGPLGKALISAWPEARQLPEDMLESICELEPGLKDRLDILRSDSQEANFNAYCEHYKKKLRINPEHTLRRLTYLPDKEGKLRLVAIFDYWSQCALRPLHIALNKRLRRFRGTDCTFDQGLFLSNVESASEWCCYDLVAATDRLPMLLQERVITSLKGETFAKHWKRLMVGFDFIPSWDEKKRIKYETGQPMGAYSSWPIMALCHHLIVLTAARLEGYDPRTFREYNILGDDVVIFNKRVGSRYKELIHSLGVEINQFKTIEDGNVLEFAKRLFYKKKEVTPITLNSLKEAPDIYNLVHFWRSAEDKGVKTALDTGNPESFYHNLLTILRRRDKRSAKNAKWLHMWPWSNDPDQSESYDYLASVYTFAVKAGFRPGCTWHKQRRTAKFAIRLYCTRYLRHLRSMIVKSVKAYNVGLMRLKGIGWPDQPDVLFPALPNLASVHQSVLELSGERLEIAELVKQEKYQEILDRQVTVYPTLDKVYEQSKQSRHKRSVIARQNLVLKARDWFREYQEELDRVTAGGKPEELERFAVQL